MLMMNDLFILCFFYSERMFLGWVEQLMGKGTAVQYRML